MPGDISFSEWTIPYVAMLGEISFTEWTIRYGAMLGTFNLLSALGCHAHVLHTFIIRVIFHS